MAVGLSHSEFDEQMIRRAIALAMRGRGAVEPNPMVGCVIVKDGRVIGEGWHQRYGEPHAEPNALAACTESPAGATAYVSLEPCCHRNKQTPPCVPRLIEANVRRVVVGCLDPNEQVAGRGVAELRDAGTEVAVGVSEASCRQLIAPFYARQVLRRPYVTLKWAQTKDGKVAGPGGARLQITGAAASEVVQDLRSRCDAILVGINTVFADDPLLTVRGRPVIRPLTRVVLDRNLRTPIASKLVQTAGDHALIICCRPEADACRAAELRAAGARVEAVSDLRAVLDLLHAGGCTHLLVEPGPTLGAAFLRSDLVDRAWVFTSEAMVGDLAATDAPHIPSTCLETGTRDLGGDLLREYLATSSGAFFAPEPSSDLVLI